MCFTTKIKICNLSTLYSKRTTTWKGRPSTHSEPQIKPKIRHRHQQNKKPLSMSSFLLCKPASHSIQCILLFTDAFWILYKIFKQCYLIQYYNFLFVLLFSQVSLACKITTWNIWVLLSTLKFLENSFGRRNLLLMLWLILKFLESFLQPIRPQKVYLIIPSTPQIHAWRQLSSISTSKLV